MPAFLAMLLQNGLGLVANAAMAKGKEFIEEKAGVKLTPDMTPEDLTKLKQFELENEKELMELQSADNKLSEALAEKVLDAEKNEQDNITARWAADATGDTLTKRIRPATLIYLMSLFTLFAIASIYGAAPNDTYIALLKELLLAVFYSYFGGRSAEKIMEMYVNHKVAIGGKQ